MPPKVDFHKRMMNYNLRFRTGYIEVDDWLRVLRAKFSVRAMSRLITVDRGVLTRKLEDTSK